MEDIACSCIKKLEQLGCSYAEVRVASGYYSTFLMKNSNLELSGFERPEGLGARFIINKAMGFFSTNSLEKSKLFAEVRQAVAQTKKASVFAEKIQLAPEAVHSKKYSVPQKKKLQDISPEEKIKLLAECDKALLSSKIKVPNRFLSYEDGISTEHIATSEGTSITSAIPRAGFFYVISIEHSGKTNQRYWSYGKSGGWEHVLKWNLPKVLADEALAQHYNLAKGVKPPKGNYDFVAAPQVVGIMTHESVGHPYEADRILGREAAQAGESFVTQKMLGTRIGSSAVSVADDPTIENSYGFYLYDNEGAKARKKLLMKNGVINEFLHNRETAASMKLGSSNGSSRASGYDRESIVRMSNTFVLPGKYSEEE
ncbi:MAG: TldD/PmbA family protein, partial [Candidatus Woesearchaeota archaeon]